MNYRELSTVVFIFLIACLLFNSHQVVANIDSTTSQKLPYTPPFDITIGNYTTRVGTVNISNFVEYVPAIFNDSRVMDFIEEYKPIWFEDLGVINSSWGSENASVCFSLISFNISEFYRLLVWLNSDTFIPFSENYSVTNVKLISDANGSLFNITQALLIALDFMDENNYNYSYLTGFYLAPMNNNNSPCINIHFTDGIRNFYTIQLALNLTIINFEHEKSHYNSGPDISFLYFAIPGAMVLLMILLIVVRLSKHYRIMKKVKEEK